MEGLEADLWLKVGSENTIFSVTLYDPGRFQDLSGSLLYLYTLCLQYQTSSKNVTKYQNKRTRKPCLGAAQTYHSSYMYKREYQLYTTLAIHASYKLNFKSATQRIRKRGLERVALLKVFSNRFAKLGTDERGGRGRGGLHPRPLPSRERRCKID